MKIKDLKKNKKGFTLVEIIVVLVILAILAAAAIPTMLGFVEDAKGKTEIANARAALVAAQAIVTEDYIANNSTGDATMPTTTKITDRTGALDPAPTAITGETSGSKIKKLVYTGKYKVTIVVGGTTTVEKVPAK